MSALRSLLFLVLITEACSAPRRASLGVECELNSACDTPLVCRLGACRNECATSGDCTRGLSCLLDADGLGACQLPEETDCALNSECPAALVCRFGECANACEDDRDCPGGARCEMDSEGRACIDRSETPCNSDGECEPDVTGERCLSGRCRRECFTDRDCRNDFTCREGICFPQPVGPDVGDLDAGDLDAGDLDAGDLDAGDLDAGDLDGGDLDGGRPPTGCAGARLTDVVGLDVGDTHACAIVLGSSPGVVCWGTVAPTSLLFGGASAQTCAARVTGLDGLPRVDAVAVVESSSCVLRSGSVLCWGRDQYGELGNGAGMMPTATPTALALPPGIVGIGGGSFGTFFAFTPTAVYGWGRSSGGSVGDGSTGIRNVETPLLATAWPGGVRSIENAGNNSCAITDIAGTPTQRCAGPGFVFGDMGGPSIGSALDLAVGSQSACALTATQLLCWGSGFNGELGDGMLHQRAVAGPVVGLPGVPVEVDAGPFHACARMADGDVWCWGRSGGFDRLTFPAVAVSTPQRVFSEAAEVRCGSDYTCIRTTTGGVQCTGLTSASLGYVGPLTGPRDVYLDR